MVAIACCLSQSSVGDPLHSTVVSLLYLVGDVLLDTPSRLLFPQSAGVAAGLTFWLVDSFSWTG